MSNEQFLIMFNMIIRMIIAGLVGYMLFTGVALAWMQLRRRKRKTERRRIGFRRKDDQ